MENKEKVCKCGHEKSWHEIIDYGRCIYGLVIDTSKGLEHDQTLQCPCMRFRESPNQSPQKTDVNALSVEASQTTAEGLSPTSVDALKGQSGILNEYNSGSKGQTNEQLTIKHFVKSYQKGEFTPDQTFKLMDLAREESMKDILSYLSVSHSVIKDFKDKVARAVASHE